MKRERSEDEPEEGPSKLQRGDSQPPAAASAEPAVNGSNPLSRPSTKVRKGNECPYLDTIARQVQLAGSDLYTVKLDSSYV